LNARIAPEAPQLDTRARLVQFPAAKSDQASAPRRRRYWIVAVPLALLLVAAGAATWWAFALKGAVHHINAPVSRGKITRTVTATGTVNPELTIIVGTYVSGVIQELYCDYNTRVTKGQVCAKIDPRPYQTVVDQAKATLGVAKARLVKDQAHLDYAKTAFERAAKLVKTSAISQDAFDLAKSAYEQAKAQILFDEATVQQRQASLDAAQVNLDYTNIVSPVDGTVVSRNVTIGQTVAASFQTPTLFLIATDLTKMQVDTNVSESDIGNIKTGNQATFSVDAFPKRVFRGVVSQIRQSPQTVQNVVTYDVVVSVDNSQLELKPGMTASTRIVVDWRDDVLRVPNAALRYRPSGQSGRRAPDRAQVWVLRDGVPTAVAVVAGLDDDRFTEIVSGDLKPGDEVVTAEQSDAGRKPVLPRLRL
jgi:HlyD family secretion protein